MPIQSKKRKAAAGGEAHTPKTPKTRKTNTGQGRPVASAKSANREVPSHQEILEGFLLVNQDINDRHALLQHGEKNGVRFPRSSRTQGASQILRKIQEHFASPYGVSAISEEVRRFDPQAPNFRGRWSAVDGLAQWDLQAEQDIERATQLGAHGSGLLPENVSREEIRQRLDEELDIFRHICRERGYEEPRNLRHALNLVEMAAMTESIQALSLPVPTDVDHARELLRQWDVDSQKDLQALALDPRLLEWEDRTNIWARIVEADRPLRERAIAQGYNIGATTRTHDIVEMLTTSVLGDSENALGAACQQVGLRTDASPCELRKRLLVHEHSIFLMRCSGKEAHQFGTLNISTDPIADLRSNENAAGGDREGDDEVTSLTETKVEAHVSTPKVDSQTQLGERNEHAATVGDNGDSGDEEKKEFRNADIAEVIASQNHINSENLQGEDSDEASPVTEEVGKVEEGDVEEELSEKQVTGKAESGDEQVTEDHRTEELSHDGNSEIGPNEWAPSGDADQNSPLQKEPAVSSHQQLASAPPLSSGSEAPSIPGLNLLNSAKALPSSTPLESPMSTIQHLEPPETVLSQETRHEQTSSEGKNSHRNPRVRRSSAPSPEPDHPSRYERPPFAADATYDKGAVYFQGQKVPLYNEDSPEHKARSANSNGAGAEEEHNDDDDDDDDARTLGESVEESSRTGYAEDLDDPVGDWEERSKGIYQHSRPRASPLHRQMDVDTDGGCSFDAQERSERQAGDYASEGGYDSLFDE